MGGTAPRVPPCSLIQKICKEYNTTYIKNMNQKEQSKLKNFVISIFNYSINIDDDNCNKTLIILFYNYFNNIYKLPVVDYITGPFTLSYHYIPSLNKKIYIFGEYHTLKNPCANNYMNIYDYLEKIFLNTPLFIDFYLEDDKTDIDNEAEYTLNYNFSKNYIEKNTLNSYLQQFGLMNYLRYKFIKCIYHKKDTLCQSIRSHYIDMRPIHYKKNRKYISELNEIIYLFRIIYLEITIKKKVECFNSLFNLYSVKNRKMLENVLKSLSGENIDNYILEEITKHPKIKKEIGKIDYSIRIKILQFFKFSKIVKLSVLELYNYFSKNVITNIENKRTDILDDFSKISEKYKYIISTINNILTPIGVLYVDIYTITRLFINFDTNGKNKKHNAPSSQNNIIIYTGNAHSENYRKFFISLNTLSENTLYNKINEPYIENNCLDMRNIPQPFFQ